MIWQDGFSGIAGRTDPEEERELRLAAQARAGAEWALGALVARYQPPVTRYLTRLSGNPDFARRAAEQIFVRMERRIRGPQGGHNLRLWLLRACTEAGLEFLRAPSRPGHTPLADPQPAALLKGPAGGAAQKLRARIGSLANLTGTTGRQVRELIFPAAPPPKPRATPPPIHEEQALDTGNGHVTDADGTNGANTDAEADPYGAVDPSLDTQDPREALRHRLVRAVLAELPYGDAQCLALHLVAGLNQAQVARALGITNSASRRRIVQGLQLFAQRYEAAAASLGLPDLEPEPEPEPELQPAGAPMPIREVQDTADVPTRILPSLDATGAAGATDAYGGYSAAPDGAAADAPAAAEEAEQEPWTPEVVTVVEPRHEIIVDSTPPDTADVAELAEMADGAGMVETDAAVVADAESGMDADADADADAERQSKPFIVTAAPGRPEPRVVEGTVAAVRIVPALTPLPMPDPQVPPEVAPAALRWKTARAVPVLTGPLPAVRADEAGLSFAAEPGAVRRVPVLTAGAEPTTEAEEMSAASAASVASAASAASAAGETDGSAAASARGA